MPGRIAPEILVQLNLKAHGEPLVEYPLRELARFELTGARAEQDRATLVQSARKHELARPFEIRAIADDELHLLLGTQQLEIFQSIARGFPASRRLHVDDTDHSRVDVRHVHRAARFERDAIAGIAEAHEQRKATFLRERLASGHADMARAEGVYALRYGVDRHPLAAMERVRSIAVLAAERTTGEANEHRGPPHAVRLALNRQEDFGDLDARGDRQIAD